MAALNVNYTGITPGPPRPQMQYSDLSPGHLVSEREVQTTPVGCHKASEPLSQVIPPI